MAAKLVSLILILSFFMAGCSAAQSSDMTDEIALSTSQILATSTETVTATSAEIEENEISEELEKVEVDVCAAFELTELECANEGTHEYAVKTELDFDYDGTCLPSDDYTTTITLTFGENGRLFETRIGRDDIVDFAQTELNTYFFIFPNVQATFFTELTFREDGYIEETKLIGNADKKLYCIFVSTYSRLP